MAIGSGIASQVGIAQEVTVGTAVAPSRYLRFESETLAAKKKIVELMQLGGGLQFARSADRFVTQRDANGDIQFAVPTKGFGLWLQNMLGSFDATATQQATTPAYLQTHVPGVFTGKSVSLQVGRPTNAGVVEAFTYPGCKITDWELSMAQSDVLKCKITADAMDELTTSTTPAGPALGTATYPAGVSALSFVGGAVLAGGTATTTGGVTSIAGGTAIASIESASITGKNASDTARYVLGGGTTKLEPIQNALSSVSGQFSAEFTDMTLYDDYRGDTAVALQLNFVGGLIATGYSFFLQIVLPSCYYGDGASPAVSGPAILKQSVPFDALSDDVNPVIQIQYQSTDTAV